MVRVLGYFFMAQIWGFFATVVVLVPTGVLLGTIFGRVELFGDIAIDGFPILVFYWLLVGYVFFVMPLGLVSQAVLNWIFTIRSFQPRYANGPIAHNAGNARNPIFEPVTQTRVSELWTTIGNLGWLPNRYTLAGGMLGGAVWLFLTYWIPRDTLGSLEQAGFATLSAGAAAAAVYLWIRGVRLRLGLIEPRRLAPRPRKPRRAGPPADPSAKRRETSWHRAADPAASDATSTPATRAPARRTRKPATSKPKPPPPRYPEA